MPAKNAMLSFLRRHGWFGPVPALVAFVGLLSTGTVALTYAAARYGSPPPAIYACMKLTV